MKEPLIKVLQLCVQTLPSINAFYTLAVCKFSSQEPSLVSLNRIRAVHVLVGLKFDVVTVLRPTRRIFYMQGIQCDRARSLNPDGATQVRYPIESPIQSEDLSWGGIRQ